MHRLSRRLLAMSVVLMVAGSACGSGGTGSQPAGPVAERPTVVVTTSILGDVVENLAGGQVGVVTVMPVGANPHDFQPSARQANELRTADAIVVNGAGFEAGLLDVIQSATAEGVPTHEAISVVPTLDEPDEPDEPDEDGGEASEHDHDGENPHFFTDPGRMATAVVGIAEFLLSNVDGLDGPALTRSAEAYADQLRDLDAELEEILEAVAPADRVLVTNHEVFGYFAARYGFEVVGAVIPSASTMDAASGGALARLAQVIEDQGVPAIFADVSSPTQIARALADEVGDVEVVLLFSESLGEEGSGAETYIDMMRTNARRIADALGPPSQ